VLNMLLSSREVVDEALSYLNYNLQGENNAICYTVLWYESFFTLPDSINKEMKRYLSAFNTRQLLTFLPTEYNGARGKAECLFSLAKTAKLPEELTEYADKLFPVDMESDIVSKIPPEVIFWMIMYYTSTYDPQQDRWSYVDFRDSYDFRLSPYMFLASLSLDLAFILFIESISSYSSFILSARKYGIEVPENKKEFSHEWFAQTLSVIKNSDPQVARRLRLT